MAEKRHAGSSSNIKCRAVLGKDHFVPGDPCNDSIMSNKVACIDVSSMITPRIVLGRENPAAV